MPLEHCQVSGAGQLPLAVDGVDAYLFTQLNQLAIKLKNLVKVAGQQEIWTGVGAHGVEPDCTHLQASVSVGL
jgi:hypothetical protein